MRAFNPAVCTGIACLGLIFGLAVLALPATASAKDVDPTRADRSSAPSTQRIDTSGDGRSSAYSDLSEALEKKCAEVRSDAYVSCEIEVYGTANNIVIMPAFEATKSRAQSEVREACTRKSDAIGTSSINDASRPSLAREIIQNWISDPELLRNPNIRSITFCYFELSRILLIDWAPIDKPVLFRESIFERGEGGVSREPALPAASVFEHAIFGRGVAIHNSHFLDSIDVRNVRFNSFVEIQQTIFDAPVIAENAAMNGPVLLRDNLFKGGLRLEETEFGGDLSLIGNRFEYAEPQDLEKDAPRIEDDGTRPSLVRLRELRVQGVFELKENCFYHSEDWAASSVIEIHDCRELRDKTKPSLASLYLQKLVVSDNDVEINDNQFAAHAFLIEIEGRKATISNNRFALLASIENNQFYSLKTYNNRWPAWTKINNNDISASLTFDRDRFLLGTQAKEGTREFRSNRVGGDVFFGPSNLPPNGSELLFTHNRFSGPVDILLPITRAILNGKMVSCKEEKVSRSSLNWNGILNFTGSFIESELTLSESCSWGAQYRTTPLQGPTKDTVDTKSKGVPCRPIGAYEKVVQIMMPLARVGVFNVRLPIDDCVYRWLGDGFRYDYFGSPRGPTSAWEWDDDKGHGTEERDEKYSLKFLSAWQKNLGGSRPDALTYASTYLRENGQLTESRELLELAKKEIYDPDLQRKFYNLDYLSWAYVYYLGWKIRYWSLAPAGFGASPERVFYWLLGSTCLWWVLFYWSHHRGVYAVMGEFGHAFWRGREGRSRWRHASEMAKARWRFWQKQRIYWKENAPRSRLEHGLTRVYGFRARDRENYSRKFHLLTYAVDTALPAISLGRFGSYSATLGFVRLMAYLHHIFSWWLFILFFGSLTVL